MVSVVIETVDNMIKEYFLFRGFTSSLKIFETDLKNEKEKAYKVERIMYQFNEFINNYDVVSLNNYWKFFEKRFFLRLNKEAHKNIEKLEASVLRLYIVRAIQNGKTDKVVDFFEKFAHE
jgi:hypothetical protein